MFVGLQMTSKPKKVSKYEVKATWSMVWQRGKTDNDIPKMCAINERLMKTQQLITSDIKMLESSLKSILKWSGTAEKPLVDWLERSESH